MKVREGNVKVAVKLKRACSKHRFVKVREGYVKTSVKGCFKVFILGSLSGPR